MDDEIKDQIELCKRAIQKALGHMSRIEQLLNAKEEEHTEAKTRPRS